VALIAAPGCKADDPTGNGDGNRDAAPSGDLPPPRLDSYPESTPLSTVAIRGTTDGTRVVVQGTASGSKLAAVLPGGNFCTDAPLVAGETTRMKAYAVGGDGRISEPVDIEVVNDSGASQPADGRCSGTDGTPCADAEVCGDGGGVDEDCNGYANECDSACNGCLDDAFEPNDIPIDVPMIAANNYTMQICPCRDDWFAFQRNQFETINATATFNSLAININLRLYKAAPGGSGVIDPPVATDLSGGDSESISFTVDEAGLYYLQVYSPVGDEVGSYSLTVN
jgi:hypothetical protein